MRLKMYVRLSSLWILFILDWGKLQNEPKVYSFHILLKKQSVLICSVEKKI